MKNGLILFFAAVTTLFASSFVSAKTVHYDLKMTRQTMNVTGKPVEFALTVNGGIPAPTLEFTEGDDAEITVTNGLNDEEVSLHWHGILLPPEEDGVPYVNTPPIFPGKSRTFRFPLRQHGTYWYHSHTMVQEQKGVYGPIVIHPKKELFKADKEAVVVLSDWSDENADQILRNLRKDGDYYQYKKNSVRSILGAAKAGQLKTYFTNEWQRMGGMDLSDVGYDAFLINGRKDSQLLMAHPGERIRLRIINAASSTYFNVALGQTPMQVISADGVDIEPVMAKELLMGMAETYDVLFTVPEHKNYELRATAQDATGYTSTWIGMGEKVSAPTKPTPDLYAPMNHGGMSHGGTGHDGGDHEAMNHGGMGHESMTMNHGAATDPHDGSGGQAAMNHGTASKPSSGHGGTGHAMPANQEIPSGPTASGGTGHAMPANHEMHSGHQMRATPPSSSSVVETLTVDELRAKNPTTLPANKKLTEFKLKLDGDMKRYVWHINGKAIFEDRYIDINEGDIVRFVFENGTMMHHPMHLHGHFFRVLNKNGEFSPLKHTVDVPPMGTRTIEFYANEPGQWMLHCHNLYHMETGMGRVVRYMSYQPKPEMQHLEHLDHHKKDHWYQTGSVQAATNAVEARYKLSQTWNEFELRAESRKDEDWKGEGDVFYRRRRGNYLNFILGASSVHDETRGQIGVGYTLPLLFETNLLVDHKGKLRVDLEKRFQWTSSLFSEIEYRWRQDETLGSETSISLMYGPSWAWSAGLKYTGESIGAGFQYQF